MFYLASSLKIAVEVNGIHGCLTKCDTVYIIVEHNLTFLGLQNYFQDLNLQCQCV